MNWIAIIWIAVMIAEPHPHASFTVPIVCVLLAIYTQLERIADRKDNP